MHDNAVWVRWHAHWGRAWPVFVRDTRICLSYHRQRMDHTYMHIIYHVSFLSCWFFFFEAVETSIEYTYTINSVSICHIGGFTGCTAWHWHGSTGAWPTGFSSGTDTGTQPFKPPTEVLMLMPQRWEIWSCSICVRSFVLFFFENEVLSKLVHFDRSPDDLARVGRWTMHPNPFDLIFFSLGSVPHVQCTMTVRMKGVTLAAIFGGEMFA
jgi:hypothetical protein